MQSNVLLLSFGRVSTYSLVVELGQRTAELCLRRSSEKPLDPLLDDDIWLFLQHHSDKYVIVRVIPDVYDPLKERRHEGHDLLHVRIVKH